MPRNPLKGLTARRKSSGNALDLLPETPPQSSFRVLERPEKTTSFDGGSHLQKRLSNGRPLTSPSQKAKSRSTDNLGASTNRGSGGTTHSDSSRYYDTSSSSARFSSTSTLPSSFDAEADAEQDDLFPSKGSHTYHTVTNDTVPEQPSQSFMSRAGRALSFGPRNNRSSASNYPQHASQPSSPVGKEDTIRDRAMTTSSYASTAVPPRLDANLGSTDFGDDFGANMFDGINTSRNKPREDVLPPVPSLSALSRVVRGSRDDELSTADGQQAPEPTESRLPPRVASRQTATPSPTPEERPIRPAPAARYSWASRASNEGLISHPASDLGSPRSEGFPEDGSLASPAIPGMVHMRSGYQAVPDRYASPEPMDGRNSPDERRGLVSRGQSSASAVKPSSQEGLTVPAWRTRRTPEPMEPRSSESSASINQSNAPSSATSVSSQQEGRLPGLANRSRDDVSSTSGEGTLYGRDSHNTTPRAHKLEPQQFENDSLFDQSPVGPPSRAINPGKQRSSIQETPKKMTRAQFEQAQRLREQTAAADDEKSEDSEGSGGEFDDEDEAERQRNIAKQRRKQEATMAVYRQQMKKVTGGQPSDLPNPGGRPGLDRASYSAPGLASSTSSMHLGGATVTDAAAEAEEDEDVPLGILQAHGFPNKTRPPNKVGEVPGSPGARQMSAGYTGSVVGDMGGSLPPFARKLPMDPYFGASLVNPANRESLAFANSGGSVYGAPASAPPPPMHPGGLVGVIAGEERARAARRGSPNPITGTYGMPLPTNMQMPQLPRASSMGTLMQPQMGMGMLGMGQMGMGMGMGMGMQPMMSPSEQAQMQQNAQMAQLMQMQTQMMQQMMAMQQGQMPQMQLPMQQQFQQQQQQMGMGMAMNNGFLNTPNAGMRPLSTISQAPSQANAGRTMSMMNPPQQWDQQTPHQRANTMGSNLNPPGYAGSIYDMHLGAPITPAGYTPSIAPSERSNIGMPSRYRPVSTLNDDARSVVMGANPTARTQTMTSQSAAQAFARQQGSLLAPPSPNTANKAKNTIRVVDKPKGTPRMSSRQASAGAEEDDDEEGWMEMKKKREEMRKRRAGGKENVQSTEDSLGELYQAYE